MKYLQTGLFLLALLFGTMVQAQGEKPVNVKKEMKQVLKELPPELQVQVLKYAERKLEAYQAIEAQRAQQAETAAAPAAQPDPQKEEAMAPVAPPKPKPAPAQTAPAQPQRPAFITEAENMPQTSVEWLNTAHDFGDIPEGEIAKHTFTFRNTGEHPLKLTRVRASCGCTTPSWSKEAIQPGEEGFIEVAFNSRGRRGKQTKAVTVTGNFSGLNMVLRFTGEVVPQQGEN
jgi:hypothetical protein